MLVITYTSDHNHPWPTQRNALAGSTRSSQPVSKTSSKPSNNNFHNVLIKEENQNNVSTTTTTTTLPVVKEEEIRLKNDGFESYRPLILAADPTTINNNEHEQQADQDFFTDLVEFESDDPLELFSTQGCKGFESFTGLFDWATTTNQEENDHTTIPKCSKADI